MDSPWAIATGARVRVTMPGVVVDDATTLMPPTANDVSGERAVALTILYHSDITRIGERAVLDAGKVELSRTTPGFGTPARPITDRYVSRTPLAIKRIVDGVTLEAPEGARVAVDGLPLVSAGGASWKTFTRDAVERGLVIELADRVVVLLHLVSAASAVLRHGLVGDSDGIARVRHDISRVADLDVPVLLRGETGTGKELVAQAIHAAGDAKRPFVAINVAALPTTTAASELFGHVRGAFTGATHDQDGLFARADGGTLFLDEVGETPFDVQPMLLRVLETGDVTPLGGSKPRRVSVRVIAATDADLETQIAESGFRSALFHRLAGYQLFVPPLRERRDDIGRLLIHFLRAELAATGDLPRLERQTESAQLWLPASLVARLARYTWPGNVRQLRNAARQLAISNRGADQVRIDPALERLLAITPASVVPPPVASDPKPRRDPADISDDELLVALRAHGWRAVGAAAQLGVSRSTLYNLIDRSKRIRKVKDITADELRRVLDACSGELDAAAGELQVSRRALKLRITDLGWDRAG